MIALHDLEKGEEKKLAETGRRNRSIEPQIMKTSDAALKLIMLNNCIFYIQRGKKIILIFYKLKVLNYDIADLKETL